ncbi:nucleotide disphospho-sugar-binding domain-containing protein [Deinococcus oregonensis]|uniref:Nucleotide disphospho-sugar-binding domain-containing protein n=1 Tax=Deinococcus oregonensis TaxID=1805970 RepID=A0ABV6B3U0_9DEIO
MAQELVRRGHEVRWYTGHKYAAAVERTGVVWEPFIHARDFDDAHFEAAFPGRDALTGLRQIKFDIQHVFVGQIEAQFRDLQLLQTLWRADAVLTEQTLIAPLLLAELGGPLCALLGILPLGIVSTDTAPFGLGVLPNASRWGRLRNRALHWAARDLIFGAASHQLRGQCRRMGVRPRPFVPPTAPHLMLQASVPSFEYPAHDQPPQLHFIGPVTPPLPAQWTLPEWWSEVTDPGRPVVLVTQGTLATDPRELIWPTLQALASEQVLVIAAGVQATALPGPLPANARSTAFVPFSRLLPHVNVYVTNGGYGGVQQALAHGIPVVAAGTTEDKAEVANRVQVAGVGLNLRTRTPTPANILGAVRTLLPEHSPMRARARILAAEMGCHDAPKEAANLVEQLARTGQAVYTA